MTTLEAMKTLQSHLDQLEVRGRANIANLSAAMQIAAAVIDALTPKEEPKFEIVPAEPEKE